MSPEELKKAPKTFCENIRIGHAPDYFVMGLNSGAQAQAYSLTPAHMKRLQQYIDYELKEYEGKHGEIKAEWSPNIVSPVQRANPPSELS
jgi:hypothetical protein